MKNKQAQRPINHEEGLLGEVNRLSAECRSLPHGLEREACFTRHVLPLMDELTGLGYSLDWDLVADEYSMTKGERGWVHPIIKRR